MGQTGLLGRAILHANINKTGSLVLWIASATSHGPCRIIFHRSESECAGNQFVHAVTVRMLKRGMLWVFFRGALCKQGKSNMYRCQKLFWMVGVSIALAGVTATVPVLCYLWIEQFQVAQAYQFARVVGAALSAGIATFAVLLALIQYNRNSVDRRIERSMSFWQRSNTDPFKKDFNDFVTQWVRLDTADSEAPPVEFKQLVDCEDDKDRLKQKLQIENVLDFYDEACTAVWTGLASQQRQLHSSEQSGELTLIEMDEFLATF